MSSFFTMKDIYLLSSKYLLHAFIFGRNKRKGLFSLASLYSMKHLKTFLLKETLLGTTFY